MIDPKMIIPMTWIDIKDENFPSEILFMGYLSDRGWVMRGPFLTKEDAEINASFYETRKRKIFTYKVELVEDKMKVRRPKSKLTKEIFGDD